MFHKARIEEERQKIFDDYFLGILKDKKVIETNQKLSTKADLVMTPN